MGESILVKFAASGWNDAGTSMPGTFQPACPDVEFVSLLNFIDPAISDPDDLVRYIEHLIIMGRRNDRDASLHAELLEQLDNIFAG